MVWEWWGRGLGKYTTELAEWQEVVCVTQVQAHAKIIKLHTRLENLTVNKFYLKTHKLILISNVHYVEVLGGKGY